MKRGLSPPPPQGSALPFKSLVPMSREALARPSDERVAVRAGGVDLRPHRLHFLPALSDQPVARRDTGRKVCARALP